VLGGSPLGVSWMDSRKCQTVTATPAKPGELPVGLVVSAFA
jgi:hypothetical protein